MLGVELIYGVMRFTQILRLGVRWRRDEKDSVFELWQPYSSKRIYTDSHAHHHRAVIPILQPHLRKNSSKQSNQSVSFYPAWVLISPDSLHVL